MGRKTQIEPYLTIGSGDLSLTTITGNETTVAQTDVVEFTVAWSGAQATNGDIVIEAWSDDITGWIPLDFGAIISLDGASSNHKLIIQQVSFKKVRPIYTRTNATASGVLNIVVYATTKGA
jgi:hypothetical protein